jgi:diacylglycerol kinase (ATP)
MKKETICFIVNPKSGTADKAIFPEQVEEHLDLQRFSSEIHFTEGPNHGTEIAKVAAEKGAYLAVAVGGDGTVNEVAQGLIGTNTSLGVIPQGSGNGFANHLKIPTDVENALKLLNTGKIMAIDTINVNGHVFIGVAGIGFDAHVGKVFSENGRRGLMGYIQVVMNEFYKYTPTDYELVIDGKVVKRKALLVSFANCSQYGNNFSIAPQASATDGYIDVAILKDVPHYSLPLVIFQMMNGTADQCKYIEHLHGREISVKEDSLLAHLDGEPVSFDEEMRFSVTPLSLNVLVE